MSTCADSHFEEIFNVVLWRQGLTRSAVEQETIYQVGEVSPVRFDGSLTLDEKREELALVRGVELRNLELVFE